VNALSIVSPGGSANHVRLVASLVLATSVCIPLGGAMTGCEERSAPQPLAFELVTKSGLGPPPSATSNTQSPAYRMFDDAASWSRFWYGAFADSMPPVDFAAEFVLCVYQGMKSTGGYEIAVREIQLEDESLRVVLDLSEPRPGDMLIQVETDPYAIYKVRRAKTKGAMSKSSALRLLFVKRSGDSEQEIDVNALASP
jgi:hypothetical protein